MPTYHPSYLLRQPEKKRETWSDVQQLMKAMGLPATPSRQ
jgi:DNA polymerase